MKYRVKLDLSFENEADATTLVNAAKALQGQAVSYHEGADGEEISYLDYHLCGHDEGQPCQAIERVEIRAQG